MLWLASPLVLLLLGYVAVRFLLIDWDRKPFCHKQMTLALYVWTNDHPSAAFPNVEGNSLRSMGAAAEQFVVTNQIFRDYHYVPGLRGDDPKELVLFYFNQPTRWRSHMGVPYRWQSKAWIVVPLDSYYWDQEGPKRIGPAPNQIVGYGEQSESLTTEQFNNRLMATLDFLRTNNRPNWQAVEKEHKAFLQSLPR